MFCQDIFISHCNYVLCNRNYTDIEDVIIDINLLIQYNVPANLKSSSFMRELSNKILDEYNKNNYSSEEVEEEEEDDILYRSIDIWLAYDARSQLSS